LCRRRAPPFRQIIICSARDFAHENYEEEFMPRINRTVIAVALIAGLLVLPAAAQVIDLGKYPDLKGQWLRPVRGPFVHGPPWDTTKPEGRGQQAPLTDEYQAIYEANLADQAAGGPGNWPGATCRGHGMPAVMAVFQPMEIVVLPDITYIMPNDVHVHVRRVFTDGREWPKTIEPSFLGLSHGKWIGEDGDVRYNTLEIETRGFKGPRAIDISGIPLHQDDQTVIKERISLDKADQNLLHNQITVIDNALTRPWTVTQTYRRLPNPRPVWVETDCAEGQAFVQIGKENYMLSADGYLMPTKKDQTSPDLRYFKQTQK
jgi:hypothetical protein